MAERVGVRTVVLSGGVFQNSYLVERAAALLESRGFRVATHQRVPANDGGIALGQAVIAGLEENRGHSGLIVGRCLTLGSTQACPPVFLRLRRRTYVSRRTGKNRQHL